MNWYGRKAFPKTRLAAESTMNQILWLYENTVKAAMAKLELFSRIP